MIAQPALISILIFFVLALLGGGLLGYARLRYKVDHNPVIEQINAILPQTQCGQCDYAGCRPYAQAIASGEAEINQCPPGGEPGIKALARLLGREALPLNPDNGPETPPALAVIIEDICIGCTKCIQACPVDAIVGASKVMHTVVADECTGCELCVPPCPVDCIEMRQPAPSPTDWRPGLPEVGQV